MSAITPLWDIRCETAGANGQAKHRITLTSTDTGEQTVYDATPATLDDTARRIAGTMGADPADVQQQLRDGLGIEPDIQPIRLRELWARYPTLREPVVDGLFRRGQVCNIVSASKAYKTYLMLGLGLAVAKGDTWLGRFPCTRGRVLILDMELQPPDIAHRTAAIAEAMYAGDEALDRLDIISLRGRVTGIDAIEPMLLAKRPGDYALVVIDPLYKCYPDPFDENSNAQMTRLYQRFERLAEHLDAGMVIVHHGTKGNQSEKRVVDVGAGASAMSRSADCHIALREHEEDDAIVLDARVRSFAPVEPMVLRWQYPLWHRALDLSPDDLRSSGRRRKRDVEPRETAPKPEPWTVERFVETFITNEPRDKKLIVAKARLNDLALRQIDDFLTLAEAENRAFRWTFPKDRGVYYASVAQPVTYAKKRAEK